MARARDYALNKEIKVFKDSCIYCGRLRNASLRGKACVDNEGYIREGHEWYN